MSSNGLILILFCSVIVAFYIVFLILGIIAFNKTQKGAAVTFSKMFYRSDFLMVLTVILVVLSILVFGLNGTLSENSIVSILSGIVGYVLGSYKRGKIKNQRQDEGID